jgi:hypothetical protein
LISDPDYFPAGFQVVPKPPMIPEEKNKKIPSVPKAQ